MQPKGEGAKWIILYGLTGIVDLFQIIVTLTGFGIPISGALEGIMPFLLIGILKIFFDVSIITNPKRLLSVLGATGFGAFTGGIPPFWIMDVWYIHHDVKNEDRGNESADKQEELLQNNIRKPAYSVDEHGNSIRLPRNNDLVESNKVNIDGIRPPNGGVW